MQNFIRMTGMDQVVWNLTNDQDLFCIWGIASLEEPLRDDLVKQTLGLLIKTIPILNCKPVTNWLHGKWQLIEKKNVDDLIVRIKTKTDAEAQEKLNAVYVNPINAKKMSMIRIHSIDGPLKHYFVIQVHHLVVDGEGLKRICLKFSKIYQELYKNKNWRPTEGFDPCRSWLQMAKNFSLYQLWLVLKAYVLNISRLATAVYQNRIHYKIADDSGDDKKACGKPKLYFENVVIEQPAMLNLKAFAKQHHVTVNDILMASFSLAAAQWNMDRGDEREWLKFAYTANLRRWWGEPSGTFGNFSVLLMYDEDIKKLQTPSLALSTIKSKMDRTKKHIGLDGFLTMMQLKLVPYFLIRRFSLWVKEKLSEFIRHSHGMTNIGIVFKEIGDFGHTTATGYTLLAPSFPDGGIVYTVTTYKNVTTIYLGCTENCLKKESARHFLLLWKQKILKVIGSE
jgi:NRPS condensation-like uncharacterized protein